MTLGETEVVPAAVAAADSKNAVDIGMNDSGHHSISATPDSQTAEDAAAANLPVESIFKFTINPSVGEPFDLQVNSAEMIQELHQVLLEREATCHRTCFTLQLNGVPLDNFTEIRNIPDLVDGSTLQVVDEPYTLRDARIHLRQVRELLRSPDVAEAAGGVDGSSLTYLPTINIQERKDKENKPFDGQPPESVVPGVKDRPLSQLLPTTPRGPAAVRDIAISSFNPVPGWRKLKGDILYITVDLVEKRRLHITCCTKGFFVNASSDHSFNPAPNSQHKTVYHSLVDLLNAASPAFKKAYALLLKRRGERALLERLPTPYPVYSWLAPGQDVSEDSLRAEESTQPHRVGFEEHLPGQIRDWNEELQTTHEMAQTELSDRIIRDRSVYKIHGDFIGAAIKGAQAVVEGNVMAINPADEPRTHMYIWNNIFYSLGFDVKDHYKELGGDAASFAATSADLQGVRAYAALENTKLCTLGMAVIDYKGYRVTAQSIIPGILDRDQEQSVIYGSIDFGKTVVSSEKYHELLESAAKTLKILPHEVVVGENGETAKLYTSFETKGIIGNDGRQYVLDLLRTMPPDVHFMENGPVSEKAKALGFPRKHPHKLAALRVELIDNFYETRCLQYIRVAAQHIRQNMAENKDKEAQSQSEQEITRILVEVSEGRVPQTDNAETRVALRKAAEAVNSLNPDTFDVRFNPDCFSEAVKHAPTEDIEKQKQLVVEAADFLLTSQLPDLVKACLDGTLNPIDGQCFTELMHARGINIRYLGEVAKKVVDTQSYMRPLVACELVARCLKHVLRPFIFPLPQDQIASAVSHLLRAVFGPASSDGTVSPVEKVNKKSSKKSKKVSSNGEWVSVSTKSVWKAVCEEAVGYYGFELTVDCVDALCEQFGIQKVSLLRRICRALGIQLLNRDYQLDVSKGKAMFTEDDVQAIYPVVKHRDPGAADAKKCYQRGQQAMQMGNLKEAYEFVAESVNLMTSVYGAIHCELAQGLRFLARLSYILGEPGEALAHQHKATLMSERCNGLDSGHTIVEYINLAHFAFANLYISAALRLLYRARYLLLIAHGEKHPVMAQIDGNIGVILFAVQEFDSAIKFLQSAEAIANPGEPKRLKSAFTYHIMARAHASRGDFRAALSAEKETNAIYCNLFGAEHEKTKDSSEFLKVLTQQAVSFQKRIMEANKGSSIAQLMPQQIPQLSLSAIVEILNILNGIIIISMGGSNNQEVESLKEAVGQPAAIPVPVTKAIDMKEEELD